jgi:hypothetical protein
MSVRSGRMKLVRGIALVIAFIFAAAAASA